MTAKQFRKGGTMSPFAMRADGLGFTDGARWRRASRGICAILLMMATTRYWLEYTFSTTARHACATRPFQQRVRQVVAAINLRDVLLWCRWISEGTRVSTAGHSGRS